MLGEDNCADQTPTEAKSLTEEQLIICCPYVKGFVLKREEMVSTSCGLRQRYSLERYFQQPRPTIRKKGSSISFHAVQNQRLSGWSTASNLDDFMDGKGRGVIILLSGSTGVGKILMAESIAETMEVPLYTLSTGEIGIVLSTRNQSSTREMRQWNAIHLLDEAGVFLDKRELNSLQTQRTRLHLPTSPRIPRETDVPDHQLREHHRSRL